MWDHRPSADELLAAESPAGGGPRRALCATAIACWVTRLVCFISTRSHLRDNHLAYMRHMPYFICGIWSLRIKFDHSPVGDGQILAGGETTGIDPQTHLRIPEGQQT